MSWQVVHMQTSLSNGNSILVALGFWTLGMIILAICMPKQKEHPIVMVDPIAELAKMRIALEKEKTEQMRNLDKKSYYQKVESFHKAFGLPIFYEPKFPDQIRRDLRMDLLMEEVKELKVAEKKNDLVGVADALVDIMYICCGTGLEYGIPVDPVFDEIHRANMSKANKDGSIKKREDGKILKGDLYTPPDVAKVLQAKIKC